MCSSDLKQVQRRECQGALLDQILHHDNVAHSNRPLNKALSLRVSCRSVQVCSCMFSKDSHNAPLCVLGSRLNWAESFRVDVHVEVRA